jgi:hypothetical protein
VQFYVILLNVRPAGCFRWLRLQRHGVLNSVCIAAVPQPGVHWRKRPSFGSIGIESHLAEVFVEPSLDVVEKGRKMIMKSGKS